MSAVALQSAMPVLTAPGLSVINNAIDEARRIFGRITSYTIYPIALTMDIMFVVVLSTIFLNFPKNFDTDISLKFFNLEPGSTIVPLGGDDASMRERCNLRGTRRHRKSGSERSLARRADRPGLERR